MAQPLEMTMRPPPTCTTGMEIPKKCKMCVPMRNEAISRIKLFRATWYAKTRRAGRGYSRVKARKTGLPPRGFTMGNRALRISRVLLATSSKGLLRRGDYSRGAVFPGKWGGFWGERGGDQICGWVAWYLGLFCSSACFVCVGVDRWKWSG